MIGRLTDKRVTERRTEVRSLLSAGASCREIARRLSCSPATVSADARALGLTFPRQQTASAVAVVVADAAARRTILESKWLEVAENALARVDFSDVDETRKLCIVAAVATDKSLVLARHEAASPATDQSARDALDDLHAAILSTAQMLETATSTTT